MSLLHSTKEELFKNSISDAKKTSTIGAVKQCPGCGVWIEKIEQDCNQMYCTICGTVWQWDTLHVVSNVYDIHNPLYFIEMKDNEPINAIFESERIRTAVLKCVKALREERSRYASDCYTYRVLYINEQISMDSFKSFILDRYQKFIKNMKLKKLLESQRLDDSEIKKLDNSWTLSGDRIKLPYV
jgi:hypothetical protein